MTYFLINIVCFLIQITCLGAILWVRSDMRKLDKELTAAAERLKANSAEFSKEVDDFKKDVEAFAEKQKALGNRYQPDCEPCGSTGWVCKDHGRPSTPISKNWCGCVVATAIPCSICNPCDNEHPPRLPPIPSISEIREAFAAHQLRPMPTVDKRKLN